MTRLARFARRHADLLVFVVTVAALTVYLQLQSAALNRDSYNRCEDRAPNILRANAFYLHMATLEGSNRFIDKNLRDARVAAYRGMVLDAPHCGNS